MECDGFLRVGRLMKKRDRERVWVLELWSLEEGLRRVEKCKICVLSGPSKDKMVGR